MIGKIIHHGGSHYKILEKLGGGGPVRRSINKVVDRL